MKMSTVRSLLKVKTLKVEVNLTGEKLLKLTFPRNQFLALTSQYPADQDINASECGGRLVIRNSLGAVSAPVSAMSSISFFDL